MGVGECGSMEVGRGEERENLLLYSHTSILSHFLREFTWHKIEDLDLIRS